MQSTLYTTDFRQTYEAATADLLRRRFLWFAGLVAAFLLAINTAMLMVIAFAEPGTVKAGELGGSQRGDLLIPALGSLVLLGMYVGCAVFVWVRRVSGDGLLKLTYWVVIVHGGTSLALTHLSEVANHTAGAALAEIAFVHVLAALFLPWTPVQAMLPVGVLVVLNALGVVAAGESGPAGKATFVVLSPLIGLPGVTIAWFRHSRRVKNLKLSFLQKRYGEVRRGLVDARRIHEALFPPVIEDGPIRFSYRYEPMHLIGGDYLHASRPHARADGWDPLSVVIMDVTGHGIPAALTVNRLHGELTRLFAENPAIAPGDVLCDLNRYVHLTLATHSVYVTALCLRLDPASDTLEYASGGHPPAFLRGVDGTIQELESTALVLGATPAGEFECGSVTLAFAPGDALIAYTDGATEARNRSGRMLTVDGIRRVVASHDPRAATDWPSELLRVVEAHRYGPPADDTLVVSIARPVISAGLEAMRAARQDATAERDAASPTA